MNWKKMIGIVLIVAGLSLFLREGYGFIKTVTTPIEEYKARFEKYQHTENQNIHYSPDYWSGIKNALIIVGVIRLTFFLVIAGGGIFFYRKGNKRIITGHMDTNSTTN